MVFFAVVKIKLDMTYNNVILSIKYVSIEHIDHSNF